LDLHSLTSLTPHPSPFRSPIALPSYHPNPTHDSSAPRRRPDGEVSPTTVWSRRWRALGRVVSYGAVPVADRLMRRLPGGASGRCPGRRASPWSGRPRCPPYRPLPVLVHHWVSSRPVSSRPVSSRPVSARPSCGVRPVPGQPAVALGITPVPQGLHGWSGSGSVWPAAGPSGSSTAEEAWTQATLRRSWVDPVGEGAGRGPGPGCAWAEAAAAFGRRPTREASLTWGRYRRRLTWSRTRDYSPWSLSSLTPEWTRLEGQ
jgi:hypothetical protein